MWVFFLEITNIWQKSQDFWFVDFFLQILKIRRLVWIFLWIFGCFECVSSIFCLKLIKAVLSQTLSEAFWYHRMVSYEHAPNGGWRKEGKMMPPPPPS